MADGGRVTLRGTRPFILPIPRSSSAGRNRMPLLNARPFHVLLHVPDDDENASLELLPHFPHSLLEKVSPDAVTCQSSLPISLPRSKVFSLQFSSRWRERFEDRQMDRYFSRWRLLLRSANQAARFHPFERIQV